MHRELTLCKCKWRSLTCDRDFCFLQWVLLFCESADYTLVYFCCKTLMELKKAVYHNVYARRNLICRHTNWSNQRLDLRYLNSAKKKVANTISLHLNNKRISETKSIKYLGVQIDSHLNWKEHIQNLSKKLSKSIGVICKFRHCVSSQILIQLYHAIIYPFLTYGCMIWSSNYTTNIKPIEILQKRSIRIITYFMQKLMLILPLSLLNSTYFKIARYNHSVHCMFYVQLLKFKYPKCLQHFLHCSQQESYL